MKRATIMLAVAAMLVWSGHLVAGDADEAFDRLAKSFVDQFPALSPVGATELGDHRYDGQLDQVGEAPRARRLRFYRTFLARLKPIVWADLSRDRQVDAVLLENELESRIWQIETLREWAWNPLVYTQLAGGAIYSLMARDFAPLEQRLSHAADRLEELPRLFEQIRHTLVPARVPKVHAETAVRQNQGLLTILDEMISPHVGILEKPDQDRLKRAVVAARKAIRTHGAWLKNTLLPAAKGDFRIGAAFFDQKLKYRLQTPLTRGQIRRRAEIEFHKVRREMYQISRRIYQKKYPYIEWPKQPTKAFRQAVTRAALEVAYQDRPARDRIVDIARKQVAQATRFVIDHQIVSAPADPLEIILMPEFRRGVSVAYCDAPGPLDRGLKTFYAVSPIPEDWNQEQVGSFLREYNTWSMQDLTMHEAMPGHYLQLAHSNRYPSTLRAVLSSGPFVEGWAVYAERVMVNQGYLHSDDRLRLINLKWYLRGIVNALIDPAIHVDGMTRDEAMRLMIEGAFQEEREAAGKWVRAQLTSVQLSTYFVGTQEHWDMRRAVEKAWGAAFDLKKYHDTILSFGSPPVHLVRALVLDTPIPRPSEPGQP